MADRYEQKLSVRPLSERKPAAPASADYDPLVELTRIVTGRSTFDPPPTAKNKTVPAANQSIAADTGLANDLESELLNDLQASFAAVREPLATALATPPPPAPAARAPTPPPAAPRPQPVAAAAPPPAQTPRPERITPPPRAAIPVAPPSPVQPKVEQRPAASATPLQTLADRPSFFRSGSGPTVDLSHVQMRPTTPATPPSAPEAPRVRHPSPRWDPPEDSKATVSEASDRFAPTRAAAFRPDARDADLADPDASFDDEAPFAEEEPFEEEFPLDDLNPPSEYGDEDELPPFPEDELANLSRRRSNRALILIAGVLVVALAGGLAYVLLGDSGSATTPPIIAADASPTKVAPETPALGEPTKESDRVDALENPDDTNLVTPGAADVASLPPAETDDNPISRVIVPAGPGFDGPIADDAGTPPAEGDDPSVIGPKKVRTVVVRPDGTIVSSEASSVGEAGTPPVEAEATPPVAETIPPEIEVTPPVEMATADPPAETGVDTVLGTSGDLAVDTDPLASGGQPTEPAAGTVPAADPAPAPVASADVTPAIEPEAAVTKPPVKPVAVARGAGGPLDITPETPAAARTQAAAGGGVLVQLSSQKSEDAALSAYQGLQRRYPGILGSFKANIQRADLGERGTYYRVRVGPFSGSDAQRLCGDLKAAGGECIIAR